MFILSEGPDLPEHVFLDADGIAYASAISRSDEPLPKRFGGPARPEDSEGPPWSTLIFGLETGRSELRERFLEALCADAEAGRPLVRYGDALESAFRDVFGGRGVTAETPDFLAFVRHALGRVLHPAAREQLARGDRELLERPLDERITRWGASTVMFGTETGHWPADHPEVMYWLSALVSGWDDVDFDQVVEDEDAESLGLVAWCGGQALRAPGRNLGDCIDVWSCAGLLNVLLRDVVRTDIRIYVHCEDGIVLAVAGTPEVLTQLRDEGFLGSEDD